MLKEMAVRNAACTMDHIVYSTGKLNAISEPEPGRQEQDASRTWE